MMKKVNNAKIKQYTTYKLEGEIKTIYFPENILELKELINKLKSNNTRYKILGNGSNLIISSSYDGVLIKLSKFDKLDIVNNIVRVGSGYNLSKLALKCAENNLSGLEFTFGIPATVGGAIYQNAGAYGFDMASVFKEALVLDEFGDIFTLSKDEMEFGYRDSILKHKNYICLEVTFELKMCLYDEIMLKMKNNFNSRKEKQPLDYPSAGSVFRNPLNLSAGRLIEEASLKGYKVGDAMVSLKHANFIVNLGCANAENVIKLIKIIQDKVKDETGILLELEQEILK